MLDKLKTMLDDLKEKRDEIRIRNNALASCCDLDSGPVWGEDFIQYDRHKLLEQADKLDQLVKAYDKAFHIAIGYFCTEEDWRKGRVDDCEKFCYRTVGLDKLIAEIEGKQDEH